MELYINNIFNPNHDIYIRRFPLSVSTDGTISVNEDIPEAHLKLKCPLSTSSSECVLVNISRSNRWMWRDWHRLSKVDTGIFDNEGTCVDAFSAYNNPEDYTGPSNCSHVPVGHMPAGQSGNDAYHAFRLVKGAVQRTEFAYEQATITSLNVTAHGNLRFSTHHFQHLHPLPYVDTTSAHFPTLVLS